MATKRPYYRTKAEWAEAKAAELQAQAAQLRQDHHPAGDWRRIGRKMDGIGHLLEEQARYLVMAERFRARGV